MVVCLRDLKLVSGPWGTELQENAGEKDIFYELLFYGQKQSDKRQGDKM